MTIQTPGHFAPRTAPVFAVVLLVLSAVAPSASAQPTAEPRTATPDPAAPAASAAVNPAPGESAGLPPASIRYLPGPDGKPVPVPANASLEAYLRSLEPQPEQKTEVSYSVAELDIVGAVNGDRAALTANVTIRVAAVEKWVAVPLQMPEAVLTASRFKTSGEISYDGFDRTTGYRWWIKGAGEHRLTLELLVPVRTQLPGRRLQLTLPESAVSRMKLSVDERDILVRVAGERSATNLMTNEDRSSIEVFGLGNRLDMTWQPKLREESVQTVLEAETNISVLLNPTGAVVDALQQVRTLQGTTDRIEVSIPPQLQVVDISSKRYRSHHRREDGTVVIELLEQTAGPIQLKWQLTGQLEDDGEFELAGLSVSHARKQTGTVSISTIEGYRVSTINEQQPNVVRINIGEVAAGGAGGKPARAYRFLKQPLRLKLKSERIEPYFLAEPTYLVNFEAEKVVLSARYPFQVFRGSVEDVVFVWPNFQSEGWTLEQLGPPGLVERVESVTGDVAEQLTAVLIGPQSAGFALELQAARPLKPGEGVDGDISWTLPFAEVSSVQPGILIVTHAENLETTVESTAQQTLRPLGSLSREMLVLPPQYADLPRIEYRLSQTGPTFRTQLQLRPGKVTTRSEIDFDPGADTHIRQQIHYDISFERVSILRMLVPVDVADSIRFELSSGEPLTAVWTGPSDGDVREAILRLEQPRLGALTVVARYAIPEQNAAETQQPSRLEVPIVRSGDAPGSETRLRVAASDEFEARMESETWQAGISASEWIASDNPRTAVISLDRSRAIEQQAGIASRVVVRAAVDADGGIRVWSQARLQLERRRIQFSVPAPMEILGVWWNKDSVTPEPVAAGDAVANGGTNELHYRIELPESAVDGDGLLTIDSRTSGTAPVWFDTIEVAVPDLTRDLSVVHTVARIVLPVDQHLLVSPADLTPQFQWKRKSFYWARETQPSWVFLEHWIKAENGPEVPQLLSVGQEYGFSRFGHLQIGTVTMMSQPMILLVGAGSALLVGLLLLRIPASRHVMFALLLIFALAVAGLWFMEPLELLFQPALLGTILAVLAVLIDAAVRHRRAATILTFAPTANYRRRLSESSISKTRSGFGRRIGSEESTLERAVSKDAQVSSEAVSP